MRSCQALGILILSSAALVSACGSDAAPNDGGRVQFSIATSAAPAASVSTGTSGAALDVTSPSPGTYTDGTNTLTLTSVQMVLREIELDLAGEDPDCHQAELNSDSCEEVRLGPVLLDLPLVAGPEQAISVDLAAGTYDEIEFELHKPDNGDPADQAFLAANPSFDGVSVRVAGTFNGQPFIFTTEVDVEQEHELNPPLTVAATGPTTLTLLVDVSKWFQTGSGFLIDPASANTGGPNKSLVENNITDSFEAFEDNDEDGIED
jgi:hypothetical protein